MVGKSTTDFKGTELQHEGSTVVLRHPRGLDNDTGRCCKTPNMLKLTSNEQSPGTGHLQEPTAGGKAIKIRRTPKG